ncbi:Type I phosphodiesterase / nucleotide pyrophosphatase [Natronorubrum sediminis]|uniref:Type I phosphodiesterase / nucleotide pyrophosphatase n=1 Tax=Natronorubrum sediminis TaxID=640943 RepID=A0A1H6G447_9EURY|nr:alkaline phosphatase family protein [Natronorubrum sediminis]SEH17866.1 Type I phosphodiesterase / nucleotide pyrophosphatase [Natronorubrum sediminis]
MKTVILGFDGLDMRYLDRFAPSLPNFSALRDRGVEAPLTSTHPPWTGSAWPSMYTGTDPSHHGVYGFFDYDGYPDEGTLVSRHDVHQPALWDYLSNEGETSIVVNVPITHPADPINGVLLPGYLAVEDEPGHPADIRTELDNSLGEEYTIYSRNEISEHSEEKFAGYLDQIDLRRRASRQLLQEHDWKLAVLQVQKTDAVFHNFTSDDKFRQVYEAADQMLGDVLETVDDDVTVIVCSDHGIGPVDGYKIHVNEILRKHGYVETAEVTDRPTLSTEKASLTETGATNGEDGSETQDAPTALNRALLATQRTLEQIGIEPKDVYAVAERMGIEQKLIRHIPDSLREAVGKGVDWSQSRAYCPDGTRMGIRVNLEGREPNGVVPQSEYEAVRTDLIEILQGLETPDGEPAFDFVCRREAVYDGPFTEDAPDILFLPTEMKHQVSATLYGRTFISVDSFDHKRDGTFIGAGPAISGPSPSRLSLTDVAPITMATLGWSVPETMTGSVPDGLVSDLLEPVRVDYSEPSYASGTTSVADPTASDNKVTDRLEDLGYL